MNWVQFKDSVSPMCLAGAMAASWSLTQDVVGLNPFTFIDKCILSMNSVKTYNKNSNSHF